jgi:hypothetical protein
LLIKARLVGNELDINHCLIDPALHKTALHTSDSQPIRWPEKVSSLPSKMNGYDPSALDTRRGCGHLR